MKQKFKKIFHKYKTKRKWKRRSSKVLIFVILGISVFSYLTNPFTTFSVIKDPFKAVTMQGDQFVLHESTDIFVFQNVFMRGLAFAKAGWHIVNGRFIGGPKAKKDNEPQIIEQIHQLRFNPNKTFLISGDHFSVLYPRSLGIFYNSALDKRTVLSSKDWQNRQLIYLKTTAYALKVYSKIDHLSTTIVPISPQSVAPIDIYSPPSDTLYSLLYALRNMQDQQLIEQLYPYRGSDETSALPVQTKLMADQLLEQHRAKLQSYVEEYVQRVYDPKTRLVRKEIYLSGAKDIARKRESSFYDNVVFWKTIALAQELDLIPKDQAFLDRLKQTIISTFWDDQMGIFLEDLSDESKQNHAYSSDWLIVQMTGFLDPSNPEELPYLKRCVSYIQANKIDQPFGVKYESDESKTKLASLPKIFAPQYGTTAIWSSWGQEYTKLLIRLSQVTHDKRYLEQAKQQLDSYRNNIVRFRGYPEVYDSHGNFFRQTFYKSVRQTGWVVSYEQAKMMYLDAISIEK